MTAISIPKELTKGDELVVIPRRLYETFLRAFEKDQLNKGLQEALDDVENGRLIGPFTTAEEGMDMLKRAK